MILLALVLVLSVSAIGLAMEWTLSGGAQYQSGNYNLTVKTSETTSSEYSVPAPKLNYTLKVLSDNWVGSAFYGNSGLVGAKSEIQQQPMLYNSSAEETQYGRSSAYGVDLGYLFSYNIKSMPLSVVPTLGYRDTLFLMGSRYPTEGGFTGCTRGLEIKGVRLGLELSMECTEEITIKANTGFYPMLTIYELHEDLYYHPEGGEYERDMSSWEILKQDSSTFDIDLNVNYKIQESISLLAGYRYQKGSLDFDPSHTYTGSKGYEYDSSRIYAGIEYEF